MMRKVYACFDRYPAESVVRSGRAQMILLHPLLWDIGQHLVEYVHGLYFGRITRELSCRGASHSDGEVHVLQW